MHRISLLLASILLLTIIDLNQGVKHHRDRHHNRHGEESLLDKQERERDKKDRKKDEDNKKEMNRNLTCYKCDGELCRDPFHPGPDLPVIQCNHSCWKGVFASSVRRACGNNRCTLSFQGGSALSNTCCQTSFCNAATPMIMPSILIGFSLLIFVLLSY